MFLLESRSKAVDASVAVESKRAESSATASQSGLTRIGGSVSSWRMARMVASMAGVKSKVAPCLSRALMGRRRLERFGRNLP